MTNKANKINKTSKVYDLEMLIAENLRFDQEHRCTDVEVEKVNELIIQIENSRDNNSPQIGDIVEFTTKHGDYYRNAHVDKIHSMHNEDCPLYICEKPYIPFIEKHNDGIYTSTSGGAWTHIPSNLKLIGQREKTFCVWGRHNACGNGAVDFKAVVNVWEYVEEGNLYCGLSTKTYDKFYVYINPDVDIYRNEYKYRVTKKAEGFTAFKTDREYTAWLKTFLGIDFKGNFANQRVVFTHKQEEKCIPLLDYIEIKGYKDTTLENGTIQECKRIEDTANKRIITYIPHQHDMIKSAEKYAYINAYRELERMM